MATYLDADVYIVILSASSHSSDLPYIKITKIRREVCVPGQGLMAPKDEEITKR